MSGQPLRVDIVSDVVCPWCIIGYKQLETALAKIDPAVEAEFHWHPFELNRDMVPEGENVAEHIARKYGATPEQSRANQGRLSQMGEEVGFAFSLTPDRRIYNTFKAHKLLSATAEHYGWQKQTELKLALFKAYFQDGRDVSDEAVLIEVANAVGIAEAVMWLADDTLAEAVRAEEDVWVDRNVSGVPAIILDGKYMIPGAQGVENFKEIVSKVLARRAGDAAPA